MCSIENCIDCPSESKLPFNLKKESNFICDKCNKKLASKQSLKNHSIICKGVENKLECHFCHQIFKYSSSKSRHIKNCKMKNNENNVANTNTTIINNPPVNYYHFHFNNFSDEQKKELKEIIIESLTKEGIERDKIIFEDEKAITES